MKLCECGKCPKCRHRAKMLQRGAQQKEQQRKALVDEKVARLRAYWAGQGRPMTDYSKLDRPFVTVRLRLTPEDVYGRKSPDV